MPAVLIPDRVDSEDRAFDGAFRLRASSLSIGPEAAADHEFLIALFAECSPLQGLLPPQLMRGQAEAQIAGHRAHHPGAMRRIVRTATQPIGRFVVDWNDGGLCHGIDIAVLPRHRNTGAALHLLRAWCEVADRFGRPSLLEVLRDNPATRLYAWLGFAPLAGDDPQDPVVTMRRGPKPIRS